MVSVATLLPVMVCLDSSTPLAFLLFAGLQILVVSPAKIGSWVLVLLAAAVAAVWLFASNLLWTKGLTGHDSVVVLWWQGPRVVFDRALLLAIRVWAMVGISASFSFMIKPAQLISSLMQLWHMSPRLGFALQVAFNILPRLMYEQATVRRVHRLRTGSGRQQHLAQALALLASAIRMAERSALSMTVRGLDRPGLQRTWLYPMRWTATDSRLLAVWLGLAVVLMVWLVASGSFHFGFY